ncbi:MAG: type I glyceraldehyde-3-phosphate dehydrogenase [Bacillaceae bacterium]|nr:type I glyceraldehyde-3-phosphate dehydrogenase [Bacillaceae bacterium]
MMRVGINGFGRIGRNVLRAAMMSDADIEIVAINDLTDADMLAHLLKYDSVHGRFQGEVTAEDNRLIVNGRPIHVFAEKDPADIPWGEMDVDIVIESTGRFRRKEDVEKHLMAGARRVIISAPAKNEDITIVMGVNEDRFDPDQHFIVSNASCTTNCLAPVAKVLNEQFGLKRGMMTTVHAYTNDQQILDLPHSDYRRARAAGQSIIPTTTGAAEAVSLVLPELEGKLSGMAMRVPVPNVSVVDLVAELERPVTADEVNEAFKQASEGPMHGIMSCSDEPLVSRDFLGNPHSSIVDLLSTKVMDDALIKVVSWYDNEWGYSNRIVDLIQYIGETEKSDDRRGTDREFAAGTTGGRHL